MNFLGMPCREAVLLEYYRNGARLLRSMIDWLGPSLIFSS